MHGGDIVAEVLKAQAITYVFTLCGGHISPILTGCEARGIRVVDTRDEATAVFAADAAARLTGRAAVALVTAGPGVTNSVTAVKNAQMAQSPVVLIGGSAPTALRGRGALQDIDQMALMRPLTKWAQRVARVKELPGTLETAFRTAQEGTPGPVFVEIPVDLLYDEATVRKWYGVERGNKGVVGQAMKIYLNRHVNRMFASADAAMASAQASKRIEVSAPAPGPALVRKAAEALRAAQRPVLIVGSQATLDAPGIAQVAAAVERIGAPVYLSGMARGLLGRDHPLQMRHKRREALREADVVLLAGTPADFRLDYGNHIRRSATIIGVNRSRRDLTLNRAPEVAVHADPGLFLKRLAEQFAHGERWAEWRAALRARDDARNGEIAEQMRAPGDKVNALHLCAQIDARVGPNTILVADGGDFVATASYVIQPPGPLAWLDPGVFGTLGVGAGFALGAKLARPDAEVWVIFGDGSVGYSLTEFDTFTRHGVNLVAVVGNDAGWTQIAREQVEMLGSAVGTVLAHSDYHAVAAGFGAAGFAVRDPELVEETLDQAHAAAQGGKPALVNAILGKSEFRKGSVSM